MHSESREGRKVHSESREGGRCTVKAEREGRAEIQMRIFPGAQGLSVCSFP